MRRRVSPATCIALVALFFSLAGTGIAASRYLITSTSQIKPSVLKQLQGARGPQGPQGSQGPTGPQGFAGQQGLPGANGIANADTTPICIVNGQIAIGHSCSDPSSPIVYVP